MITTARRCSTQKAACWYRLLTADQVLEVIRPFVLLLRHGYWLLQNIKSIRGLEMFQDAKCYLGYLYNERSFCDEGVNEVEMVHI